MTVSGDSSTSSRAPSHGVPSAASSNENSSDSRTTPDSAPTRMRTRVTCDASALVAASQAASIKDCAIDSSCIRARSQLQLLSMTKKSFKERAIIRLQPKMRWQLCNHIGVNSASALSICHKVCFCVTSASPIYRRRPQSLLQSRKAQLGAFNLQPLRPLLNAARRAPFPFMIHSWMLMLYVPCDSSADQPLA